MQLDPPSKFKLTPNFTFYPQTIKLQTHPFPTLLYKPRPTCPFSHTNNLILRLRLLLLLSELAINHETLEDSRNIEVVTSVYEALRTRHVEAIQKLLAPNLEYWFHGPPSHQYLMRLLTGEQQENSPYFQFVPRRVSSFGPIVLAEGFDPSRSVAWVHAWTVSGDDIITQVREYFNTSLTVTRFGKSDQSDCGSIVSLCTSVWESSLPGRVGKSVPGLVLAI